MITRRWAPLAILMVGWSCAGSGPSDSAATDVAPAPGALVITDDSGTVDPCVLVTDEELADVFNSPVNPTRAGETTGQLRTCELRVDGSTVTMSVLEGDRTEIEFDQLRSDNHAETIAGIGLEAWYSTETGYWVLADDALAVQVAVRNSTRTLRDEALALLAIAVERVTT